MAKAARDILAVPASEVDVVRLFSGGRDLLGIRRYALKGETMRVLTLLKAFFERQLKKGTADLPEVYLQNTRSERQNANISSSQIGTNFGTKRQRKGVN